MLHLIACVLGDLASVLPRFLSPSSSTHNNPVYTALFRRPLTLTSQTLGRSHNSVVAYSKYVLFGFQIMETEFKGLEIGLWASV